MSVENNSDSLKKMTQKAKQTKTYKKVSCNIKLVFVLKYGSHWYIKQWITTNQLIAVNYKVQVKFVN